MDIYDKLSLIMSVLGVPALFAALCRWLIRRIKASDVRAEATQRGIQAMLRAQMISEYNKALDKGYAPIYAKDNFENAWKNYHALGANGVMDDIHERYMNLPDRKENQNGN